MIGGASIPSPTSSGIQLGPVEVHVYGLLYVVALAAAVAIVVRRWEARGGSRELVYDVTMWAFPAGLIGGRIYFDLTSSGEVPAHWWGPFAVWDGGMGIWGGIALGTLVGIWRLRRAGISVAAFMDAAAPALLVGQAIGRVGNYFNQELFGGPTNLPWALQISPAHRPAGYAAFATFHPTFLYELIWNLALAAFLVWLGRHRRIRPPGLFALYVTGYSAFRIFEESLRVDPAHYILGLRLNFYVACALTSAGALWFLAIQRQGRASGRSRWRLSSALAVGGVALFACGCGQAGSSAVIHPPNPPSHSHISEERPPHPKHLDVATPAQEATVKRTAHADPPPVSKPAPQAKPEASSESESVSTGSLPPASAGTNGAYTPPPPSQLKAINARTMARYESWEAGERSILVGGIALAPPGAPGAVKVAISAANEIVGRPYVWGGGHGSWYSVGYDCSGAVSYALGGAGLLSAPLTSTALESWGAPGPGRWITVYANSVHAYAVIAGLRWDTVGDARGTGPRWHAALPYPEGFVARHPLGY
jgi:prolipoprotein diacylglyceryl transferase